MVVAASSLASVCCLLIALAAALGDDAADAARRRPDLRAFAVEELEAEVQRRRAEDDARSALPATRNDSTAALWDGWHRWAVLVTSPGVGLGEKQYTPDSYRAAVLSYDPDCMFTRLPTPLATPGTFTHRETHSLRVCW